MREAHMTSFELIEILNEYGRVPGRVEAVVLSAVEKKSYFPLFWDFFEPKLWYEWL